MVNKNCSGSEIVLLEYLEFILLLNILNLFCFDHLEVLFILFVYFSLTVSYSVRCPSPPDSVKKLIDLSWNNKL